MSGNNSTERIERLGTVTQSFTDGVKITAEVGQDGSGEILIRVRIDREGAVASYPQAAPPTLTQRAELVRSIESVRDDCGFTSKTLDEMVNKRFSKRWGVSELDNEQLGAVLEGLLLRRRQLELAAEIQHAITTAGVEPNLDRYLALKHPEKKLSELTVDEQKEVARHFKDACRQVLGKLDTEETAAAS